VDDQAVAGAQDAAKELGYEITGKSVHHLESGETAYGFSFDAEGQPASVEFLVDQSIVLGLGLTVRDYARWEILDALREPDG
jgi:hypothetical protein